ncbi:MAG: flippase-like domain-containing protein, partial [Chloroflexi bacterium]|nr:flippase-like domain-containing protein [Chloroflexota bacterium]
QRAGVNRSATLGTLVLERLNDVLVLSLSLIVLVFLLPLPTWVKNVAWLAAAAWALGLSALIALAWRRQWAAQVMERLACRLLPSASKWFVPRFRSFVDGLAHLLSLRVVLWSLALSLAVWAVQFLPFALVGVGMGLALPIQAYLLLAIVFNLANLVPALPGRLGTLEFVFAAIMLLFQYDQSMALSYALLFRLTHLLPVLLGGLFLVIAQRTQNADRPQAPSP